MIGRAGDIWNVWWRDPSRKFHLERIAKVDTLKEVHAVIKEHKRQRETV